MIKTAPKKGSALHVMSPGSLRFRGGGCNSSKQVASDMNFIVLSDETEPPTITRSHAMYVVPVKAILDPDFTIRMHEELKAAGQLVVYEDGMEGKVLFCSHTWLKYSHPDNDEGVKLELLRAVLKQAMEGKTIEPHVVVQFGFSKKDADSFRLQGAKMRRDLENGYVFFECEQ